MRNSPTRISNGATISSVGEARDALAHAIKATELSPTNAVMWYYRGLLEHSVRIFPPRSSRNHVHGDSRTDVALRQRELCGGVSEKMRKRMPISGGCANSIRCNHEARNSYFNLRGIGAHRSPPQDEDENARHEPDAGGVVIEPGNGTFRRGRSLRSLSRPRWCPPIASMSAIKRRVYQ